MRTSHQIWDPKSWMSKLFSVKVGKKLVFRKTIFWILEKSSGTRGSTQLSSVRGAQIRSPTWNRTRGRSPTWQAPNIALLYLHMAPVSSQVNPPWASRGAAAPLDSISPSHVYILMRPSYGDLLTDLSVLTKSNNCQRLRQPSERTPWINRPPERQFYLTIVSKVH